jgi:hypothetical protein
MRCENDIDLLATRKFLQSFTHTISGGFDEMRMVVKNAQLVYGRGIVSGRDLRRRYVLAILPAAGIRAVCGSYESERMPHSAIAHLPDSVYQEWMPISISPVNRKLKAVAVEFLT